MKRWIGLMVLAACEPGSETDPEPPVVDCAWAGEPELQAGIDLAVGPAGEDDTIPYGNPPQGGAPYAPYQLRAHMAFDPEGPLPRWALEGEAVERETGAVIGAVVQPQTFFCSNTGPHQGWMYGGEIHLRFPGIALVDLEGKAIDVRFEATTADGEVLEATGGGTLAWTLGRIPGDDQPPG